MFEILDKEIEILNERLNSIKKYIIKNELEKRIIETKALEEFESIDLIEYRRLITEENKSPINYNAVIISLYGCYENFIDNILIDFLDILAEIGIDYEKLDKSIISNHERLVGNFLSNTNRYKNYDLNTKDIINKLNGCINGESNYKLNSRILINHSGNLNIESINTLFNQIGIKDIWNRVKNTNDFIDFYGLKENIKDRESVKKFLIKDNDIIFNMINDLVERRNSVAHSWNEDTRVSNEELREKYIPFILIICKAIYRILMEVIYNYLFENNKLIKIQTIHNIYNNRILCINSEENVIYVNDFIYIIRNQKKSLAKVENIQIDHVNVEKCDEQQDIGLKLDTKINGADEIYIYKNGER